MEVLKGMAFPMSMYVVYKKESDFRTEIFFILEF